MWHLVRKKIGQVVKASKGHFPQPFLISDGLKNCSKVKLFLNTKSGTYKISAKINRNKAFISEMSGFHLYKSKKT
jgi:hypothetical protein